MSEHGADQDHDNYEPLLADRMKAEKENIKNALINNTMTVCVDAVKKLCWYTEGQEVADGRNGETIDAEYWYGTGYYKEHSFGINLAMNQTVQGGAEDGHIRLEVTHWPPMLSGDFIGEHTEYSFEVCTEGPDQKPLELTVTDAKKEDGELVKTIRQPALEELLFLQEALPNMDVP